VRALHVLVVDVPDRNADDVGVQLRDRIPDRCFPSGNTRTSCPAFSVAAATHAKPSGKGVSKPLVTLLLEMSSTLTIISPAKRRRTALAKL
jgi:hypothetical protein